MIEHAVNPLIRQINLHLAPEEVVDQACTVFDRFGDEFGGGVGVGDEGPVDDMTVAGLTRRQTDWDDTLADTAMILAPTPVYSHAAYAALALGLLAFLLRRRRPPDIAVAGLLGAALTFTGSFFIISIACDYRYLYALDVAAIAGAVYAAATFRDGAGVARSGGPRSRPSLAGEESLSTTRPPGC